MGPRAPIHAPAVLFPLPEENNQKAGGDWQNLLTVISFLPGKEEGHLGRIRAEEKPAGLCLSRAGGERLGSGGRKGISQHLLGRFRHDQDALVRQDRSPKYLVWDTRALCVGLGQGSRQWGSGAAGGSSPPCVSSRGCLRGYQRPEGGRAGAVKLAPLPG